MWITVIAIIVVFILGKFFYDKSQQAAKITMEGGMRNKYGELIGFLMSGDSRSRIFQETSDSITVGISSQIGGSTLFTLIQTFGNITIQYRLDNPIYGKHEIVWDFPEYGDQKKMAEIILADLGIFQQRIMK